MKTQIWMVTDTVTDPDSSEEIERSATGLMVTSMPRFEGREGDVLNLYVISEDSLKEIDAAILAGSGREHEISATDTFDLKVIEVEEGLSPEGYLQEIHVVVSAPGETTPVDVNSVIRRFHRHQQLLAAGLVQSEL